MNEETQFKLMAFLDGELPKAEEAVIADLLKSDQEAAALVEELTWAKQAIAGNETGVVVPETRDFYWSKITRGIEAGERQSERASRPSDKWWYKLLVPVSGFAALVVGFAILNQPPVQPGVEGPAPTMPVAPPELETPQDVAAQASTYEFYAEDQKMSVIWVTTDEAAEFESPTRDPLLENE
jgi:anti-sigma factor RsiW